jgi:hypothetical protein
LFLRELPPNELFIGNAMPCIVVGSNPTLALNQPSFNEPSMTERGQHTYILTNNITLSQTPLVEHACMYHHERMFFLVESSSPQQYIALPNITCELLSLNMHACIIMRGCFPCRVESSSPQHYIKPF